jgi:hypothetical protein
MFIE